MGFDGGFSVILDDFQCTVTGNSSRRIQDFLVYRAPELLDVLGIHLFHGCRESHFKAREFKLQRNIVVFSSLGICFCGFSVFRLDMFFGDFIGLVGLVRVKGSNLEKK